MATLLKVLNNLADIKSAGGVALRVRTQAVLVLGGSNTLDQEALCVRLKGTKYLDPAWYPEPGLHWCPDLSDAAPEDVSLLPTMS